MGKKLKIVIAIVLVIIIVIAGLLCFSSSKPELRAVKSNKELLKIYEGKDELSDNVLIQALTMPFLILSYNHGRVVVDEAGAKMSAQEFTNATNVGVNIKPEYSSTTTVSNDKDYSKTNIQVENVDEADITKTDGDYIYSISETNVIITDVRDEKNIKIASKILSNDDSIPDDMILYKDKLVVISSKFEKYTNYNGNTVVKIYDISNKENPVQIKKYELYADYYTSRCIDNMLYVIASGRLRKEDKDIIAYYKEDNSQKDIGYDNIKYLKDVDSSNQTLISVVDLNNAKSDIKVNSYLINIKNAYVSQNSIYLLNQEYSYNYGTPPISSLFGLKGLIGPFIYDEESDSGYLTEIYKFNILKNGQIEYSQKAKIKGKTINQYSLDEFNGHLRVALYDSDGARIAIFDENLKEIGISDYVAKGETMYSSRFIGDKAYLVTYKTIDPLFVFDLSDETKPKVLGELKIPGYSTYLHPYDENHLIGIGMETQETIRRNSQGKVISNSATIVGMKMALFDISDVNNPVTVSSIVIGDRRTTSAILTNPKALLFSKEKDLIAIPVNNYNYDFQISSAGDTYSSIINGYTNYSKSYVSEGYIVYDISPENGFKQKGMITHEVSAKKPSYNYYSTSRLLRGLYIDENLYTVSEMALKVNRLDNLEQISELKIIGG